MPGSIIRGNYMHDTAYEISGIYNDEASGGFLDISENVVANSHGNYYFYHNVGGLYPDRQAATRAVMHDNFWNCGAEEPLYQEIVEYASVQPGMPFSTMEWCSVENYAHVYTELLAGRGMFLFPVRYPSYPAAWYRQVWLPLPDTVLLTLRDDPRPEILTLRQVFTEVYGERIKALLP